MTDMTPISGELQTWVPGAAEPAARVKLAGWSGESVTPQFSADGRRLVVIRPGAAAVVHDTATGSVIAEFRGVFPILTHAALTHDGRRLALSREESIQTYDVDAAAPLKRLVGHRGRVHCLRFAEDGRLVSWAADGTLRTWSLEGLNEQPIVPAKARLAALKPPVISPDGRWIALCDDAGNSSDKPAHSVIWDSASRTRIAGCPVLPIVATADSRELIGLHSGQHIGWYDSATGAMNRETLLPHVVKANLPRISPDGRFVAYWAEIGHGFIHDLVTNVPWLEMDPGTVDAQFSPDGKSVGLLTARTGLRVIDLATKAERPPVPAAASKLAWSLDSRRIGFVKQITPPSLGIVDVATMKEAGELHGQGAEFGFFAFSNDGQTIVSTTVSGALTFWHLPTWSRTLTLPASDELRSFAFTHNDEALVIGRSGGFTLLEAPHTPPAEPDHGALAEPVIEKVLRALFAACQVHQKEHGEFPASLESLQAAWPADVPADAIPWAAFWYAYENAPAVAPPDAAFEWTKNDPPTQREITAWLTARDGPRRPVLRCFARRFQAGRVFNISHGGEVYVSGVEWSEAAEKR